MTDEILLITRMRTLNKGNQALSVAWIRMLEAAFPGRPMRVLERRPRHLLQYTLAQIAADRDPVRAFRRLADRAARLAPGPELAGAPPASSPILLDERIVPPARFVKLRQRLNLRGRAAQVGMYANEYRQRLSAMQRASLVVVNPAGEFFPREPAAAFYHLLDAQVALALGKPTAIVNHTLDVLDPTLRKIIPAIYPAMRLVVFRDERSVDELKKMGGDTANVEVAPDLVLTIEAGAKQARRAGTIAVAVNVPEAAANRYLDRWFDVIGGLRADGWKVELVSNELPADRPFYDRVRARFPELPIAGADLDHDRYCGQLAAYDFVVTSRMHTGILAMIAGTPIVAVEGSSFKISALFHELGLEAPVIRPGGGDWPREIVERARLLRDERDGQAREASSRVTAVRERISSVLIPRLRTAFPSPS